MTLIPLTLLVIFLGVYPKPVLEPINNSVKMLVKFMDKKAVLDSTKNMIQESKSEE